MTDNHKAHTSDAFQALLAELGARHILTPPYTPRWNGKLERFNQTLDDEWARSREWPNSHARDRALRSFLRYYNRRRPHTSLGDRPPISRVHHL
jgi:transposase InsO family protein